jgi:hypothetical protein
MVFALHNSKAKLGHGLALYTSHIHSKHLTSNFPLPFSLIRGGARDKFKGVRHLHCTCRNSILHGENIWMIKGYRNFLGAAAPRANNVALPLSLIIQFEHMQ